MTGSLLQLRHSGPADIHFTGNPQMTFFKSVYPRYTNFALQSIEQNLNGTLTLGNKVSTIIDNVGDLIKDMYLEVTFTGTANKPWPLHAMIDYVEILIGGQSIDKRYGDWIYIWNELTLPISKKALYYNMTGHNTKGVASGSIASQTAYLPLNLWFSRNPGMALPIIALNHHDIQIDIKLNSAYATSSAVTHRNSIATLTTFKLWVDYIFLDINEKRLFSQTAHEYVIEQVQFTGDESVTVNATNDINLNYNYYVKELVWVGVDQTNSTNNHAFNYLYNNQSNPRTFATYDNSNISLYSGDYIGYEQYKPSLTSDTEIITNALLLFDGKERFEEQKSDYFAKKQVMDYHSGTPAPGIYTYSFCLEPENYKPTGGAKFGSIDDIVLRLTVANISPAPKIKIYALNYNILKIMSGQAGLAYSK
jgi:hypothetical protein